MRTDQTFTTRGEEVVLAVSLELAAAKWKVALHDGRREKPAVHTVAQPQAAARLQAVLGLIEAHKEKWSLPAGVRVVAPQARTRSGSVACCRRVASSATSSIRPAFRSNATSDARRPTGSMSSSW